jgi:hypothetical protein
MSGDRLARAVAKVRRALATNPEDPCWACSMGRCGQGPKVNTCTCCRNGHRP